MENDYIVRLIPLPTRVNGFTALDDEGLYNIYINEGLTAEGQRRVLRHELAHIRLNHFYLDMPLAMKEQEARRAETKG